MHWKNHFWFPNEPFIEQFLKVPSYLSKKNILVIWKTFCTPFKVLRMLKVAQIKHHHMTHEPVCC